VKYTLNKLGAINVAFAPSSRKTETPTNETSLCIRNCTAMDLNEEKKNLLPVNVGTTSERATASEFIRYDLDTIFLSSGPVVARSKRFSPHFVNNKSNFSTSILRFASDPLENHGTYFFEARRN
jgi:hypothetical protein